MAFTETTPGIQPDIEPLRDPGYDPLWDPPVIPDRSYDPFTTPVIPPDLPQRDAPPSRWVFPEPTPEELPDVA